MGLKFVDGPSLSLEGVEGVTSTPFMVLTVTGIVNLACVLGNYHLTWRFWIVCMCRFNTFCLSVRLPIYNQ